MDKTLVFHGGNTLKSSGIAMRMGWSSHW